MKKLVLIIIYIIGLVGFLNLGIYVNATNYSIEELKQQEEKEIADLNNEYNNNLEQINISLAIAKNSLERIKESAHLNSTISSGGNQGIYNDVYRTYNTQILNAQSKVNDIQSKITQLDLEKAKKLMNISAKYIQLITESIKNEQPKCGLNSSPSSNGNCSCNSGYVWQDPNDNKNFDCIKKESVIDNNQICKNIYGPYSYGEEDKNYCSCISGYVWNSSKTSCIKYEPKCGLNSSPSSNGNCSCNSGYTWQDPNDSKNYDCVKKEIIKTPNQLCQDSYGLNSIAIGKQNTDGTYNCNCKTGYVWNTNQTACIEEVKVETQKKETYNLPDNLIVKIDTIFEKIKLSKANLTDQQKTKFYEKLDKQLDQMYAKQKKEQNKNIINYLKSLVKIELDNLGSLDDLFGDDK